MKPNAPASCHQPKGGIARDRHAIDTRWTHDRHTTDTTMDTTTDTIPQRVIQGFGLSAKNFLYLTHFLKKRTRDKNLVFL